MTKQQREWFSVQLELFDHRRSTEAIRLIAGYQLDFLGTELTGVLITKPHGVFQVAWLFEIPEAEAVAPVVQMPARVTATTVTSDGSERVGKVSEAESSDGKKDDETER